MVPEICISTLGRMHVAKIGPRALLTSVSNLPGCLGSSCRDQTHVSSFLCWFRYTPTLLAFQVSMSVLIGIKPTYQAFQTNLGAPTGIKPLSSAFWASMGELTGSNPQVQLSGLAWVCRQPSTLLFWFLGQHVQTQV